MEASTRTHANDLELIQCCASRIINLTTEIERAWEIGIPHGEHREPWTMGFQEVAVRIYLETVPASYAIKVALVFKCCSQGMLVTGHPAEAAEDWRIVASYLETVSDSIFQRLGTGADETQIESGALRASAPGVVRYDKIAALLHPEGVRRQLEAANSVSRGCLDAHSVLLEAEELAWIRSLAEGCHVVDLGVAHGLSTRNMYRNLATLWRKLGVDNRIQGVAYAARMGWLEGR